MSALGRKRSWVHLHTNGLGTALNVSGIPLMADTS